MRYQGAQKERKWKNEVRNNYEKAYRQLTLEERRETTERFYVKYTYYVPWNA